MYVLRKILSLKRMAWFV